jgi:hypothetical protein
MRTGNIGKGQAKDQAESPPALMKEEAYPQAEGSAEDPLPAEQIEPSSPGPESEAPEVHTARPTQAETEATESQRKDELGIPLLGPSLEAFKAVENFRALEQLLRQAGREINALAHMPGGDHYRREMRMESHGPEAHFREPNLTNALSNLKFLRPHSSVCPYCWDEAKCKTRKTCKVCQGLGYVTKSSWNQAPEEMRRAVTDHFLNQAA